MVVEVVGRVVGTVTGASVVGSGDSVVSDRVTGASVEGSVASVGGSVASDGGIPGVEDVNCAGIVRPGGRVPAPPPPGNISPGGN